MNVQDRTSLAAVATQRAAEPASQGSAQGYRIGPDDLLDIRIPDLFGAAAPAAPAMAGINGAAVPSVAAAPVFQQGIRVSADGNINVPTLGLVRAEGLTAGALEQKIAGRLVSAGLLRAPQVSVLVAEYRSWVVAVVGSVERPGLYPLTRPGATVADLICAAGGPSKDAGRVAQFSPGSPQTPRPAGRNASASLPSHGRDDSARQMANSAVPSTGHTHASTPRVPAQAAEAGAPPSPTLAAHGAAGSPIRIDLDIVLPLAGRQPSILNPQVRQGDVISVLPAGNVQVDGWVEKPGSYPVTRSLTVSGAVAAAGGTNFASDRTQVAVKRVLNPGEESVLTVDLEAVAESREPDLPITDGDVVYLPVSSVRVVPWGIWKLLIAVFRGVAGTFPIA